MNYLKTFIATAAALCCAGSTAALSDPPAFPGAVGFGANATGGRGGTIYHVTNLNDSGPGSFRDAVSEGPRIIVFDVSGYIPLTTIVTAHSNLTIAGQSAPGAGIGVQNAEVSFSHASNIICRGMRFREGTNDPIHGKSAVNIGATTNVILDHCSFEFGKWDTIDAVHAVDFTVQNSIIADPIGQQFGAHVETGPGTFYRDLWVNAHNRQPLAKNDTQFINNVVYNYNAGYTAGRTHGPHSHDIINNYFIAGPSTGKISNCFFQMGPNQSVYASGNLLSGSKSGHLDGSPLTPNNVTLVTSPWSPSTASIPVVDAATAFATDVANDGAMPRDEVDAQVISQVSSLGLSGAIIKSQADDGLGNDGYGILPPSTREVSPNSDGIPNDWKKAHGIDVNDPDAASKQYGNTGYTVIETYLNSLLP